MLASGLCGAGITIDGSWNWGRCIGELSGTPVRNGLVPSRGGPYRPKNSERMVKGGVMDSQDLKRILAGLSIAGLLVSTGVVGCTTTGKTKGSMTGDKMMEESGSSMTGDEMMKEESGSSMTGDKMMEESGSSMTGEKTMEKSGSSCTGEKKTEERMKEESGSSCTDKK